MPDVRTRFAPSPTGYMHIGGMRTALFNWLWARHTGGKFILRIDDTDRQRNIDEALRPILAAFRWLGLDWDEGAEIGGPYAPYFQSQRTDIYRQAADRLLDEKKAYRDFEKPEDVQRAREAAEREKRPFISSRRSLELSDAEVRALVAQGRPHVVRFLVPRGKTIALDDVVRGHVEWDTSLLPDPVIMRPDGTPLYNFATVIDDAGMKISHVIRAEEHLSNTPIQILLHQALGNTLPIFAHIPFVTAPGTTKKLSKRDLKKYRENPKFKAMFEAADRVFPQIGLGSSETLNPVMVEYYEKIGFLPQAVLNALARLGWSLDDRTEFMSLPTIVENFTLERIVKNPAGLDPDKLYSFQTHWMSEVPLEKKVEGCLPYLVKAGLVAEPPDEAARDYVRRVIVAVGERLKIFSDILDADYFFRPDEQIVYDGAALAKRLGTKESQSLLRVFLGRFTRVNVWQAGPIRSAIKEVVGEQTSPVLNPNIATSIIDFVQQHEPDSDFSVSDPQSLERQVQEFVRSEGIKIGDIIHSVRLAVTGRTTGPGLYDTLALLGRERVVGRIDRLLARLSPTENLHPFPPIPEAIRPRYEFTTDNDCLTLHKGNLSLLIADSFADLEGEIYVDLQSPATVGFRATVPQSRRFAWPLETRTVMGAEGWDNTTHALITGLSFLSRPQELRGILQGRLFRGKQTGFSSAVFHLLEFHDFIGDGITDGSAFWAGRAVLEGLDWRITLDRVYDLDERRAAANSRGTYALSHVGRLEKCDFTPFDARELDDALSLLACYLSFVRGFWVSPILPVAYDASGAEVWRECGLRRLDRYRVVGSWFPVQERDALQLSFPAFAAAWAKIRPRERLESLVYWYTAANASLGALENGIIATQIALESIWHLRFGRDEPEAKTAHPKPEDMITDLLKSALIPLVIPESCDALATFAHSVDADSGPTAFCRLRNLIVHPTDHNLNRLLGMAPLQGRIIEAWQLGLWYLELLLLHTLSYQGRYVPRIRDKTTGQTEHVPWLTKPAEPVGGKSR